MKTLCVCVVHRGTPKSLDWMRNMVNDTTPNRPQIRTERASCSHEWTHTLTLRAFASSTTRKFPDPKTVPPFTCKIKFNKPRLLRERWFSMPSGRERKNRAVGAPALQMPGMFELWWRSCISKKPLAYSANIETSHIQCLLSSQ